jgi:uncharacterized protein YmfQ (DUF2313 family)
MRKIEKEMNYAISQGRNWSSANTMVRIEPETRLRKVYLHGNHIADVYVYSSGWGWTGTVNVNAETLSNWPTVTTKSRLRALGVDVQTRKGVTYVDGEAI